MRYAVAVFVFAVFSPAGAQEKTFDSNGTRITYLDEGKAVVLLHGFSASSEEMWTKMPFAVRPDRQTKTTLQYTSGYATGIVRIAEVTLFKSRNLGLDSFVE